MVGPKEVPTVYPYAESKPLADVIAAVRKRYPHAAIHTQPGASQIGVTLDRQSFSVAALMNKPNEWPLFALPVPAPSATAGGSWECHNVDDVLSAFDWPRVQPKMTVVSVAEVQRRTGL